ncbi:MAG: hypothetical protein BAJATHORv1_70029 [Candidatus Thorarchaeota archaeon]|nr:MAG: hypothetical protein BAJATHORv1_70029 [Candidatus Thorarchaeota archaeon]
MDIPKGMLSSLQELVGSHGVQPVLSRAPGRIEVLGNHTDYNGGVVLAATIDRFVWALGILSDEVRIHSIDYDDTFSFSPQDIPKFKVTSWTEYAKGIYWALNRRKHNPSGMTAVVKGDVPQGSGLSSSAAFEVALTNLVSELNSLNLPPKAAAMIAFEAERVYCMVSCGVMDQFTSQLGQPNSLIGINCQNLQVRHVNIHDDIKFVVVDSMISRAAGDALNQRRHECQQALRILNEAGWNIGTLSDIDSSRIDDLDDVLEEKLSQRVEHVVRENLRVRKGIEAIQHNDLEEFGSIMFRSHISSRNLYEVSHPNLDMLVDMATRHEGVLGARMTGAGFGGAILCMVKSKNVTNFVSYIQKRYESETGKAAFVLECDIPGGVQLQKM